MVVVLQMLQALLLQAAVYQKSKNLMRKRKKKKNQTKIWVLVSLIKEFLDLKSSHNFIRCVTNNSI